jgi:putative glutamine amidotransferase
MTTATSATTTELRPLIAVTTSELRTLDSITPTPEGEPVREEMALSLTYLRAVQEAGGIPVVTTLLSADAIDSLLAHVDGVCLSGGPDIDPSFYGEAPHAQLGPTWPELDAFELAVARAADARGLPILAICRGAQVFNIARRGSLYQHLPDVVGEVINHRQLESGTQATHGIVLAGSSRLRTLLDCPRTQVNSFHHQAIAELGENLIVTAHADDGSIEAVEATDREFAVAVQWHAETMIDRPGHAALFAGLIDAARDGERHAGRSARVA